VDGLRGIVRGPSLDEDIQTDITQGVSRKLDVQIESIHTYNVSDPFRGPDEQSNMNEAACLLN
jgi:hypothetical protein